MSTAPSDKPAEPTPAPPPMPPAPPPSPPAIPQAAVPTPEQQLSAKETAGLAAAVLLTSGRIRVLIAAALFFGWLGWLSFTALTKSREPIVSRAQASLAPIPVRATVTADEKGAPTALVTVVESLKLDGPAKDIKKDMKLVVMNLPTARGFIGPGDYLLLLAPDLHIPTPDGSSAFQLVGPRSSGTEADGPTIYPWSSDVEMQARRLYRPKD